jgi:ADP-ribosylglycohydrolase
LSSWATHFAQHWHHLEKLLNCPSHLSHLSHPALQENVRTSPACTHSLANGSTIRATPLAICAHCLSDDAIAACAMADAGLSHPRLPCQHANAAYVIAAASLIRLRGNAAAALAAAERWAVANASKEVLSWLEESKNDGAMEKYDANSQMGFVKHAFQLAFYHLRRGSSFSEGLRHTLLCGGDTGEGRRRQADTHPGRPSRLHVSHSAS